MPDAVQPGKPPVNSLPRGIFQVTPAPGISIPAGGVRQFPGRTRFLAIYAATKPLALQVSFNGQDFSPFPPGFLLHDFDAPGLWIKNTDGSTNVVRIVTGLADLTDNRFAPGTSPVVAVDLEQIGGNPYALGQTVMAGSAPVAIASDQTPVPITGALTPTPSTAGATSDFNSLVSAVLLAANANRKGATIYNEGAGILYVKLAAAPVSTVSYTVQIPANGYYTVPANYIGEIRAIFGAAGTARVTELT